MGITIEQLLKNKGILEEKMKEKIMILEVESFKNTDEFKDDAEITIKSLTTKKIKEITEKSNNNMYIFNQNVVYDAVCSMDLKSKELQEAYGCKTNPLGIVEKLFLPYEIKAIANKVALLSGVESEGEIIKEIKK